jgi:hypothetical protein
VLAAYDADDVGYGPLEPEALESARGRASRAGSTLTLFLKSGSTLALDNRRKGCAEGPDDGHVVWDDCVFFSFVAALPDYGQFLVWKGRYEGGNFLLIDDRTGREAAIEAPPQFAPDGQRFLVVDNSVASGDGPTLEVWRMTSGGPVLEWTHKNIDDPVFHQSALIRWRDDQAELDLWATASDRRTAGHWRGMLRRDLTGWHLEADWPNR